MPIALVKNPAGAFGQPLNTSAGLNDLDWFEAVNNSGTWLYNGSVVVWDNDTALSTVTPVLMNANSSITVATQTITANASTASYAASGALIIPMTVTGTAGTNTVPVFVSYTGITGSTFTGAKSATASVTNGAQANASIFQWPTGVYSPTAGAGNTNTTVNFNVPNLQSVIGLPAAPSDGGRYVTLSQTGAVSDPLVAGVVVVSPDSATTLGSIPNPNIFPSAAIPPGATCQVAYAGVARVQILGTVTAGNLMSTAVSPGYAQNATQGTLGNMLGVALEANTAKDANTTIRVALKIG